MILQIDQHTLDRAEERGTNKTEIEDVVQTGVAIPAKFGRIGKVKIYDFKQKWRDKYYEQKRVEVFYLIQGDKIKIFEIVLNAESRYIVFSDCHRGNGSAGDESKFCG